MDGGKSLVLIPSFPSLIFTQSPLHISAGLLTSSPSHLSPAHGDHWSDRGGVHCGSPLRQQDKVRGQVHDEALSKPGNPSDGVSPQDGGDRQGTVLMPPPHITGTGLMEQHLETSVKSDVCSGKVYTEFTITKKK